MSPRRSSSPPSDVAKAPVPQTGALLFGAPEASPSALPSGRPGQHLRNLLALPRQTRGGDVRNALHPPVRAVDHVTNQRPGPVILPAPGGESL